VSDLRIVFAGSPAVAVPSLDALNASRHDVVGVVTRADAPVGRRGILTPTPVAARAEASGLDVIRADRLDAAATERIASLHPDLGVVVAYGALVREPLLSAPRLGWINLHFSLLPRWRGAAPVQHAILAGDSTTGVSVFRLVAELDAGPLVATRRVPIGAFQTAGALLEQLATVGAEVLVEAVDALANGTAELAEQVGEPTFAPKLSAADGVVDWRRPANEIDRRIRAMTPEPGASTTIEGARLKIAEAAVARDAAPLEPGLVAARGRRVLVGTADAPIELLRVHPAGRTEMPAAAWLRGRPPGAETRLG